MRRSSVKVERLLMAPPFWLPPSHALSAARVSGLPFACWPPAWVWPAAWRFWG